MNMKLHCSPGFDNRSVMVCDWLDQNGFFAFQERAYWPKHVLLSVLQNKPPTVEYWVTNQIYTDFDLAKREGGRFGFLPCRALYDDAQNPSWFPVFTDDINKVLAFLRHKTGTDYTVADEP
jgi:hypothetical protein